MSVEGVGGLEPVRSRGNMLAEYAGRFFSRFGKGEGFIFLAIIEVAIIVAVAIAQPEALANLTGPLGAVNIPVYGGGAWKAASEAKNGKSNGISTSGA